MKLRQNRPPKEDAVEPLLQEDSPTGWPPPPPPASKKIEAIPTRLLDLIMDRRFLVLIVFSLAILAYFVVISPQSSSKAKSSLVKAFVAFRHGTRAPGFTYGTDRYSRDDKKLWPDGPGELTKAGKYEGYELGATLRARYRDFIGDYYKPNDFRAYSTLVERTLMTAQLVLASFFPPQDYQKWNVDMNWQPIPVYPDNIVNGSSITSCPRFIAELKRNVKHILPADLGLDKKEAKLLLENSGEPNASLFTLFIRVYDTTFFQARANLPIPEWIKPMYPDKMLSAAVKFFRYFLAGTHYQRLLVLGPYGRGLIDFFTQETRKMELHSWHDINVMGLLYLLGVELGSYPEPACAVAVELHDRGGEQFLEAYYFPTPTTKEPRLLKMSCGSSCPLSDLIFMSKVYLSDDYMELCNSAEGKPASLADFKMSIS